jgi:hypothetical protein
MRLERAMLASHRIKFSVGTAAHNEQNTHACRPIEQIRTGLARTPVQR